MLSSAFQNDLRQRVVWKRSVLAVFVVLTALFSLVAPLLFSLWSWLVPIEPAIEPHSLTWLPGRGVVSVLLVLLIGWSLLRGKRQAWWVTVATVILSLPSNIIGHIHWLSLVLTVSALILLLWYAPLFSTRSEPRMLLRGYLAFGGSALSLLGTGLFLSIIPHGMQIAEVVSRREVLTGLHILEMLLLFYGLLVLLRPVGGPRAVPGSGERTQARRVLSRDGRFSLAYFTLSEEKRYFWSETGHTFLAYVVHTGVALVLGEPIGPQFEHEELLRTFLIHCRRQDWTVALYQAGRETARLCRSFGLQTYTFGEDAIINIGSFTLQGKKGAPVRHSVARAKRSNITVQCWHGEILPEQIFAGMSRVSSEWEHERKITQQMRFSMGSFPEDWSPDLLTVVACDAEGEVQAFLTWTPMYAAHGWSLDLIRRSSSAAPGTMEHLIVDSLEWARRQGSEQLSLGLAPLSGLNPEAREWRPSSLERSALWLHQKGLLLGNYRSLRAFKAKFQPDWQERYLIVQNCTALPKVFFALACIQGYTWKTVLSHGIASLRTVAYRKRKKAVVCEAEAVKSAAS